MKNNINNPKIRCDDLHLEFDPDSIECEKWNFDALYPDCCTPRCLKPLMIVSESERRRKICEEKYIE